MTKQQLEDENKRLKEENEGLLADFDQMVDTLEAHKGRIEKQGRLITELGIEIVNLKNELLKAKGVQIGK